MCLLLSMQRSHITHLDCYASPLHPHPSGSMDVCVLQSHHLKNPRRKKLIIWLNPGQKRYDQSSSAILPQNIEMILAVHAPQRAINAPIAL